MRVVSKTEDEFSRAEKFGFRLTGLTGVRLDSELRVQELCESPAGFSRAGFLLSGLCGLAGGPLASDCRSMNGGAIRCAPATNATPRSGDLAQFLVLDAEIAATC